MSVNNILVLFAIGWLSAAVSARPFVSHIQDADEQSDFTILPFVPSEKGKNYNFQYIISYDVIAA